MHYIKRTLRQKLSLLAVSGFAFLLLAATPVAYAGTPSPNPTGTGAQAAQCQGNANSCVCPTEFPDCGSDPAAIPVSKCDKTFAPGTSTLAACKAKTDIIKRYVNPAITLLSFMVGLAVVIGILIGGIEYIGSAGDPAKAAKGKDHIWNAIIALIVYLFLFALLNFLIPGGLI